MLGGDGYFLFNTNSQSGMSCIHTPSVLLRILWQVLFVCQTGKDKTMHIVYENIRQLRKDRGMHIREASMVPHIAEGKVLAAQIHNYLCKYLCTHHKLFHYRKLVGSMHVIICSWHGCTECNAIF